GDGKLVESCSLDRACDVDLDLHVLLVALEGRAPEVAAGAEAEGRREELLDLPHSERDEELLLLLGEAEGRLALLASKGPDEADVDDERGADRLSGRVIDREDGLTRGRLAETVKLHARAIDAPSAESLEVRRQSAGDFDLPLGEEHAVHERVRIDLEDALEHVPPLLRRRVRLRASGQDDAELGDEVGLELAVPLRAIGLQRSAVQKVGRSDAVALSEARDDGLALVARELVVLESTRHAADVGHAAEVIDEVEIVGAALADCLEVVGHARRTVDDADVLGTAVLTGGLVDDVANLGEAG